jgi:hypothetical protein
MQPILDQVTILYTCHLRGQLQRLPRLYGYLQQLQAQLPAPVLLLDLGESCAANVWHCQATAGRSTLVVLDGMGYHAVNVSGFLTASEQERLKTLLMAGMVDERHVWRFHIPPLREEGILVAAQEVPALHLCIVAAPASQTALRHRTLTLQDVRADQVGMAQVDLRREPVLTAQAVYDVPAHLLPDATISAAVEFVEEEAREFQNRRG